MVVDPAARDHDPFRAGEIARVVPTTEPQREVIAAAALGDAANTAYNEAVTLRLTGRADAASVERALRTLVERHDALRATFTPQLDTLCIGAEPRFELERVDLTTLAAEDRERAVLAARRQLVGTPLPLCEGPLFRARWLQLGDESAELQLLAHHAVCDGWSYHVLLRELAALCGPTPAELPPAPSFAEFAELSARRRHATHDARWLQKFAAAPAPLDLPTDRPRLPRRTFAAGRVERRLQPSTTAGLADLAGRLHASSVAVLLAGVAALLHRLADHDDVVLGLPVARQALEEQPDLVGHCVQLLPIRLSVESSTRFETVVAAARAGVLDATEHYDFTFGSLVRSLGLGGRAERVPLIPVLVNIDQSSPRLRIGEATAAVATVPRVAEAFEIFLNVVPDAAGNVVEATFNTDLYTAATMTAWLGALECLLVDAINAPATTVGSLALVAKAEAGSAGFDAEVRPPGAATWLHAFAHCVRTTPDAVAVHDARGALTYAELDRRATALAGALVRAGVGRGDVVGVCVSRSRDLLVAFAGIHRSGAAHLPLDPALPPARLQLMVADAHAKVVVADTSVPADVAAWGVEVVDSWHPGDDATAPAPPAITGDDLAYLIYTSGSTGTPKGVRVRHGSLVNVLGSVAQRPGFGAADTLLAITTVSFDISLLELLLPLTVGGRVALATQAEAEDPKVLAHAIRRHRATVMQATPATWRMLADDGWEGAPDLIAFCGGERLPAALARDLLPRVLELWNLYGPTETTIWSTAAKVLDPATASLVGRPLDNTSVRVLDRAGAVLPAGIPGEICIGGAGVAAGYHERPQLTAERFVEHPQFGRLYRTGDRGRIRTDGSLECLGRLDQQVKVRGYRIELGEIESVLGRHPDIADAAVAVQGDEQSGVRIVAFVVARSGTEPPDLRDQLQRTLPAYMVPHRIVTLPALPRLQNGKLDRRSLPRVDVSLPAPTFEAPSTPTEQLVAAAMAKLLGNERLGADGDFFSAGGHSLLAAQLVARLNQAVQADLSLHDVFEAPTPRRLAQRLDRGAANPRGKHGTVPRRANQDSAPATPVQERMWHLEQMTLGRSGYNLPSAHRLRGTLDEPAFVRALQEVVRRQAVLRTSFERRGGALLQIVHADLQLAWPPVEDLSDLPATEREARLATRLDELAREPFDLAKLPLFRVQMFRLAPDEHVFFFMPHHIVWDGWSFDLLYQELDDLYGAFAGGRPSPLADLQVSYGDIAAWQRERSTSAELRRQADACRERLQRFGPVQALPVDRPRTPGMSGKGACEWLNLDAARTRALHELGRERGATLFATTLAIYSVLLHEYSRQPRILLATPVRGRESLEQEPVMGCCNSLVPLPIEVLPADTFEDLMARVRATLIDGLSTADVTLEQLGTEGRRQGAVLYQALFSFQDVRRRRTHWGSLRHEMIPLFQRGATEDLGLWFVEGEQGLGGILTYNADVLTPATAVSLRDRFLAIADAVVADPRQPLANVVVAAHASPAAAECCERDAAQPCASGRRQGQGEGPAVRNDFELILTRIWESILGVDGIGVHDDFFELGGNSLLAIRCVNEFERATGIAIELGEVFRSPTVARLTASLGSRSTRPGPLLIPLQGLGSRPPLFCLLGVWIYRHLALGLGKDQPVYGVYVPEERAMVKGLASAPRKSVSIEQLAAAYTQVITATHPRGPYRLAGLSFGGVVAMEVARRLRQAGAEVDCVVLIDTILPSSYRRRWWARWRHLAKAAWSLGPKRTAQALRARLGWRRARDEAGPTKAGEAPSHDHAFRHIAVDMRREVARWQAQFAPPDWRVLLLRATENVWGQGYEVLPDYGWGAIVGPRLQVANLAGDHLGILLTPEIGDLAGVVRSFLENASGG